MWVWASAEPGLHGRAWIPSPRSGSLCSACASPLQSHSGSPPTSQNSPTLAALPSGMAGQSSCSIHQATSSQMGTGVNTEGHREGRGASASAGSHGLPHACPGRSTQAGQVQGREGTDPQHREGRSRA